MGKVTIIKKSRKEHKCSKCGKIINIGDQYYKGVINFRPDIVRCNDCKLKSYEVTTSDYILNVGRIVEDWEEDYSIQDDTVVDDIINDLNNILDELNSSLDNIPENLAYSPTADLLNERIESIENAISDLESIDIDTEKENVISIFDFESIGISDKDEYFKDKTSDSEIFDAIVNDEFEELDSEVKEDINDLLYENLRQMINDSLSNINY